MKVGRKGRERKRITAPERRVGVNFVLPDFTDF
jgi:hypothetical protein